MLKKLTKFLLTAGAVFSFGATVSAAEVNPAPVENENVELPEYLVKGVAHDVAQKIFPFSIEGRYFSPHMDINVKSDKIRYRDGSVGLKSDLGFGNDNAPEVILRYKRFTMDYIRVHGTGERTFTKAEPLLFGGTNLRGTVNSDSEFHYLKLQITNPIVSAFGSGVDWSYGLTGIFWKGSAEGTEVGTGRNIHKSEKFAAPVPTLGIGAHASLLPEIKAYAHISGLPLGGYGHFYDFEAGIRYNPTDFLGIDVGYRKIHANIKHKNDSGNFTLSGPYAGLRFDF